MGEEIELTQALIRNACVNDGSSQVSEVPNAELLHGVLGSCGVDIEQFDAAPGRRSIIARLPGVDNDAPTLMFLAHTDVVPATATGWQQDPFGGELVDGFLWGRGALDMLGHVATMSLALRDYAAHGSHRSGDVILALVADEEALGTHGMEWLQENAPEAVKADWVVTETGGIPSGPPNDRRLGVLVSEKGAWRVKITVQGDGGHGSMPPLTSTALSQAAEVISRIAGYRSRVRVTPEWRQFVRAGWGESIQDALLEPTTIDLAIDLLPESAARTAHALTRNTFVPTVVKTTGSWNLICDTATIDVDVRTIPGCDRRDVFDELHDALGDLAEHVSIEIVTGMESTRSQADGPLWNVLQKAAQQQRPASRLIPAMAPGATDARFMRERGAQAFGFGLMSDKFPAGELTTMLHGVNERIDIESLAMMRRLWGDVLAMYSQDATR
jgi:acetylornithine deacetylase/succinyl-diaminopimelate desuccinylase-like protein